MLLVVTAIGCNRQGPEAKGHSERPARASAEAASPEVKMSPVESVAIPQAGGWGAIQGHILWGGEKIPPRNTVNVQAQPECLLANPTADPAESTILDENILVEAKNKGLKNVFVYLLVEPGDKIPVHPSLQKFPQTVEIDQPACMFWPRAVGLREGQVFVVKNSSDIPHNIRWTGDAKAGNEGRNILINPGNQTEIKDLKAQRLPLPLECNIHGWMKGRLGVFSHPYFAITDDSGRFEIKDAPAGLHKLMIYHEEFGYRLGSKGKNGEDVTVKAGGITNLGNLPMGP
jgi:hypothetical protein